MEKEGRIVGCNRWMYHTLRHPSSNLDTFISQLENLIRSLNQSKHPDFILGDVHTF